MPQSRLKMAVDSRLLISLGIYSPSVSPPNDGTDTKATITSALVLDSRPKTRFALPSAISRGPAEVKVMSMSGDVRVAPHYRRIWLLLCLGWIISSADRTITGPVITWMIQHQSAFMAIDRPYAVGGLIGSISLPATCSRSSRAAMSATATATAP